VKVKIWRAVKSNTKKLQGKKGWSAISRKKITVNNFLGRGGSAIPFWPSRASSLSSNRSDSRGIRRAGARSPSLSVFRFLFGPIRHPFHFFAAQFVAGGVARHRFIFFQPTLLLASWLLAK
jgi:hypothetical protein